MKTPSVEPASEDAETERLFRQRLDERIRQSESSQRWSPVASTSGRAKRGLKRPVTRAQPDNMFDWHLDQHSIIEDETDPELIKNRIWLRRVGVKGSGRLTEAQIATHEKRLGIRLPEPWRDVYRHFNGGKYGASTLFWGDMQHPREDDIVASPHGHRQYLALEDVAPWRDLLPEEWETLDYGDPGFVRPDFSRLDPRLITIACVRNQAVLLDYREGTSPRVCVAYISEYDDDPLAEWETGQFTYWWPNMAVFFRGLYLQNRAGVG